MSNFLPARPLTDAEIHKVLGFQDSGLIDWGFTEEDLPVIRARFSPQQWRALAATG